MKFDYIFIFYTVYIMRIPFAQLSKPRVANH